MKIVGLSFAALGCGTLSGGLEPTPGADTYLLKTVDGVALPAYTDRTGSRLVVSGSLTLQPDGYFVLEESDSIRTGLRFLPKLWIEGGRWAVDGSVLTLTDTAADATDSYGPQSSLYVGRIAPQAVVIRLPAEGDMTIHAYYFEQ